MSSERKQSAGGPVERRTVVKGAAWSMPVIAASVAAPLASASGEETYTVSLSGELHLKRMCSFVLPAGAKDITYTVAGGAGGNAGGGPGAMLMGTISTPAVDTEVTIIAAGGGQWGGGDNVYGPPTYPPRAGLGGEGFGNGGNSAYDPASAISHPTHMTANGSGGGGGSALLVGGTAFVVAGGGGGRGTETGQHGPGVHQNNGADPVALDVFGRGGSGAMSVAGTAPDGRPNSMFVYHPNPPHTQYQSVTAPGGGGASPTAGGAGGSTVHSEGPFRVGPTLVSGNAGTLGSTTAGGNGGDGVISSVNDPLVNGGVRTFIAGSSGGGGGYAGGGSGGVVGSSADAVPNRQAIQVHGGGGGGGSNYVGAAGGLVATNTSVASAENNARWPSETWTGGPGFVTITFRAPAGQAHDVCLPV